MTQALEEEQGESRFGIRAECLIQSSFGIFPNLMGTVFKFWWEKELDITWFSQVVVKYNYSCYELNGGFVWKSEFTTNRPNYSVFSMPQNVFRSMHAKCIALAQTSFEESRKHTKFMKNPFFLLGWHRSGRRRR